MSEQHIKDLEIRNFKCFKHLNIVNIGQVNLIAGKNNVGKTAFLEAVGIFYSAEKPTDLAVLIYHVLKKRQGNYKDRIVEIDFFHKNESEFSIKSSTKVCTIKKEDEGFYLDSDNIASELTCIFNDKSLTVLIKNTDISVVGTNTTITAMRPIKKFGYISSSTKAEKDIAIAYGKLIDLEREDFLNSSLILFDTNLVKLKPVPIEGGVLLKLETKHNGLILLSSLGEGINRYIAILCAIWANKDGVLLIDEIENGIHYTNYKKLWEIIFKTSIAANCQIFITTHSKECITAFNDVQFEDENCNAQYFEFYKNLKTDLITSTARDKEQLRYALTHEGRLRGE